MVRENVSVEWKATWRDGTLLESPANYVPAAAVIRRGRGVTGITGRKVSVGGLTMSTETRAQLRDLQLKLPGLRTVEEDGTASVG